MATTSTAALSTVAILWVSVGCLSASLVAFAWLAQRWRRQALEWRQQSNAAYYALELSQKREAAHGLGPLGLRDCELEALLVRRWLRNACESREESPQKAVVSAAAVALALVGREELTTRLRPLCAHDPTDMQSAEGQAVQQWQQVVGELEWAFSHQTRARELSQLLYGEAGPDGLDYWNGRELAIAAGDCLQRGHVAAVHCARLRGAPPAKAAAASPT